MNLKKLTCIFIGLSLLSCNGTQKKKNTENTSYPDVKIVDAMKNVMWKGALGGKINLDSIADKKGLYGLGPLEGLKGELLINDGKSYVSKVTSDSTMSVTQNFKVSAPFFVYAHVTNWKEVTLPAEVKTIQAVQEFINEQTKNAKRPFAFKLKGKITKAEIHIQNLPEGAKVSSPKEAHQGQVNYPLEDENVEIIGFFSTEHQGVFTHHDSFLHMHLVTQDEQKMGHLDNLEIDKMKLYLPKI